MSNFYFKKCDLSDLTELQKISINTFTTTYQAKNTPENFNRHIAHAFNSQQLTKELIDPNSEFYFLFFNDKLIGYLKLNENEAQTENMQKHCYELERIYLIEKFQGKGFGKILIKKSIEVAKEKNKKELWLGVWEENPAAIGFYSKMGFVEFGTHIFKVGEDEQMDFLLKIEIE